MKYINIIPQYCNVKLDVVCILDIVCLYNHGTIFFKTCSKKNNWRTPQYNIIVTIAFKALLDAVQARWIDQFGTKKWNCQSVIRTHLLSNEAHLVHNIGTKWEIILLYVCANIQGEHVDQILSCIYFPIDCCWPVEVETDGDWC